MLDYKRDKEKTTKRQKTNDKMRNDKDNTNTTKRKRDKVKTTT